MTNEDLEKEVAKIYDEKLTKWKTDRLVNVEYERKRFKELYEKEISRLDKKYEEILSFNYIPREEGCAREY